MLTESVRISFSTFHSLLWCNFSHYEKSITFLEVCRTIYLNDYISRTRCPTGNSSSPWQHHPFAHIRANPSDRHEAWWIQNHFSSHREKWYFEILLWKTTYDWWWCCAFITWSMSIAFDGIRVPPQQTTFQQLEQVLSVLHSFLLSLSRLSLWYIFLTPYEIHS